MKLTDATRKMVLRRFLTTTTAIGQLDLTDRINRRMPTEMFTQADIDEVTAFAGIDRETHAR